MAQQDYGPAQPIADWVRKNIYDPAKAITGAADKIPVPSKAQHVDPEDVRKATETFRKAQEKPAPITTKAIGSRKRTGQGKSSQKKSAKRY